MSSLPVSCRCAFCITAVVSSGFKSILKLARGCRCVLAELDMGCGWVARSLHCTNTQRHSRAAQVEGRGAFHAPKDPPPPKHLRKIIINSWLRSAPNVVVVAGIPAPAVTRAPHNPLLEDRLHHHGVLRRPEGPDGLRSKGGKVSIRQRLSALWTAASEGSSCRGVWGGGGWGGCR